MASLLTQTTEAVSATVRTERARLGLSQEALAARMKTLGQTSWLQTTVAKVENKQRPRPVSAVEAVALTIALELPRLDMLFGESLQIGSVVAQSFADRQAAARQKLSAEMRRLFEEAGADPATLDQLDNTFAAIESMSIDQPDGSPEFADEVARLRARADEMDRNS